MPAENTGASLRCVRTVREAWEVCGVGLAQLGLRLTKEPTLNRILGEGRARHGMKGCKPNLNSVPSLPLRGLRCYASVWFHCIHCYPSRFFFHPAPSPEGGARVGGAVRMEGPEHPFLGVWPRQEGPRPRLPPAVLLWLRHHLRTGYQVPGPWGKVHCRNHSALNVDQVRNVLGNAVNVRTRAVWNRTRGKKCNSR